MNAPAAVPGGVLTLVCSKCTREHRFYGATKEAAGAAAERKGWRYRKGKFICRRCPK